MGRTVVDPHGYKIESARDFEQTEADEAPILQNPGPPEEQPQ